MLESIIKSVTGIQNKQKSLMWGSTRHSETEVMFAVGHKSYPRKTVYFLISVDYKVQVLNESIVEETFLCADRKECIYRVIEVLKEKFPSIGGEN